MQYKGLFSLRCCIFDWRHTLCAGDFLEAVWGSVGSWRKPYSHSDSVPNNVQDVWKRVAASLWMDFTNCYLGKFVRNSAKRDEVKSAASVDSIVTTSSAHTVSSLSTSDTEQALNRVYIFECCQCEWKLSKLEKNFYIVNWIKHEMAHILRKTII